MNNVSDRVGISPERVRALTGRPAIIQASTGPNNDIGHWLEAQRVRITGRANVFQVEVSPELASAWLKFNTKNRNPSKAKIRRYSRQMLAGRWILNGETIKFGADGRLLDGQSRLMAIVAAGVPILLEIRGGLADSTQESMDTGEARKHSHQLEMLGEKYPNEIAAALRLVFLWENGMIAAGGKGDSAGRRGGAADITNTTIRETLERHEGIRASVGRCLNLRALLPISAAAFFHYIFGKIDPKKADLFVDRLTTGANLSGTSAIYQLRERLTSDRLAQAKIGKREKFALIIKSWNAFRAGRPLPKLRFDRDETFPDIAGIPDKSERAA